MTLSFAESHGVESAEGWAELRRNLSMQIAELVRRDCESRKAGKVEYLRYYRRPATSQISGMRQVA
jgi:hypothetical protein